MAVEDITTKQCNRCRNTKPITEFSKNVRMRDGMCRMCKHCSKVATAAWRAANLERARASEIAYRAANRDKVRAAMAKYSAENADKIRARASAWYAANPTRAKASRSKWYIANAEKVREATAKWQAENPKAVRVCAHNTRARRREAGGKLSKGLTERLYKLQRGKCACCKKPLGDDYHLDHIMPIALGGSNTDDNIQLLRATCNQQKHAKHPVDFMQQRGFLI